MLFANSISCSSKELIFLSVGVKLTSAQGLTLPKSQAQWASSCYNCPRAHTLRVELPQVPKINSGSILTATASIVILARAKDGIFTLQFTKFLRAGGVRLHGIDDMIKSLPRWAERKYTGLLSDIMSEFGQPMPLQECCRLYYVTSSL